MPPVFILLAVIVVVPPTLIGCNAVTAAGANVEVTIDWNQHPVHEVDPREFSFAWDIYALSPEPMARKKPFDLLNKKLQVLTRQLGPAVLRVSGTGAENVQIKAGPESYVPIPEAVFAVTRKAHQVNVSLEDWDLVGQFASAIGADLVLGLNQLTRQWPRDPLQCGTNSCVWDSSNARAWLQHNRAKKHPVYGYELGNEPGCYMPKTGITPAHAAADFGALKELISEVYGSSSSSPLVIGPDVGGCKHAEFMAPILAEKPPLDVVAFHHYVMGGAVFHKNPDDINASAMAKVAATSTTRDVIASYIPSWKANASQAKLWLGEGGTTCANQKVQRSFAMIFNCFNILREGGVAGVSLFVKQSLPLMYTAENENPQPLAMWWFAYMWKNKMRSTSVRPVQTSSPKLLGAARGDNVALLNLDDEAATIVWSSSFQGSENTGMCDVFTLSPVPSEGAGGEGDNVLVNGKQLTAASDGSVPRVEPASVPCNAVSVPSKSVVFVQRSSITI